MEVRFANERLKKLCESRSEITRRFGPDLAKKLKLRLDDLDAAAVLEQVRNLPGQWEELRGNRKGQLACRLFGGHRLIVCPTTQPIPLKPDGGMDWRAVDGVTVLEVVDYHE